MFAVFANSQPFSNSKVKLKGRFYPFEDGNSCASKFSTTKLFPRSLLVHLKLNFNAFNVPDVLHLKMAQSYAFGIIMEFVSSAKSK